MSSPASDGFTEEQIIAVLKEAEAGAKTKDLCRKYGISDVTFCNWKAKYAGLTVSEARRLKELEAENSKLKKLLAGEHLTAPLAAVGNLSFQHSELRCRSTAKVRQS